MLPSPFSGVNCVCMLPGRGTLFLCGNIASAEFSVFLGEHAAFSAEVFIQEVTCGGWSTLFGTI